MFSNQVGSLLARVNRTVGRVRDRATRDAFVNFAGEISRVIGNPFAKLVHRGPIILIPPPNGRTLKVGGDMIVDRIVTKSPQTNEYIDYVDYLALVGQFSGAVRGVLQDDLLRDDVATLLTVDGVEIEVGGYFIKTDYYAPSGLRCGAAKFLDGEWHAIVTDDCLVHV